MAVNTNPNQIQLEVQINREEETFDAEPIEQELEPIEVDQSNETETPPKQRNVMLLIMAFLCIFIVFFLPFVIALWNYWTDVQLLFFIESTKKDYMDSRNYIMNDIKDGSNPNIATLTCNFNDELADFDTFLRENMNANCNCTDYMDLNCSILQSQHSNGIYQTTNFDLNDCSMSVNASCFECNCDSTSIYAAKSPQFSYLSFLYESEQKKDNYCSPKQMNANIRSDSISDEMTHCFNACAAFLVLSVIWLLCVVCGGFKVRIMDLMKSYNAIMNETKKRKGNNVNKDEFTIFVISLLFLHIFQDIPQCIIAIMFCISKQKDGGSDCITNYEKDSQQFSDELYLTQSNGGTDVLSIMSLDSTVLMFFVLSFLNVFFSGFYAIRLFKFNLQKVLVYSWWKNAMYFVIGILLGFFGIFLVLAPFWGCLWVNRNDLFIPKSESDILLWTWIAGMSGYVVAICFPLCFAEQACAECGGEMCGCGDGCC